MNVLKNMFAKKQPPSPAATKLHEVITTMCATPGPTNNKGGRSATLYELMPASKISKDIADLFVDVVTFTTVFMMGPDTRESIAALGKLCAIQGPVVNNLLRCISTMGDGEQNIPVVGLGSFGMTSTSDSHKASFEPQRRLASAELKQRGSPKYDPRYYVE
jgi:hypothetical protein